MASADVEGEYSRYRLRPGGYLVAEGDVDAVGGVDEGIDRDFLADAEGSFHEEVMEGQVFSSRIHFWAMTLFTASPETLGTGIWSEAFSILTV